MRELLAGRTLAVPDTFDTDALRTAAALAAGGDRHLADTLTRAGDSGRITQDLAGAPELLRRYHEGTEPEKALLRAAMDARRLGMGLHLPWAFLVDASADYLDDDAWDTLDDWAQTALDELSRPGHGTHAPLRRTGRPRRRPTGDPAARGPVYRLADHLEQHGRAERRRVCPPASFWEIAADIATPDELVHLVDGATSRGRDRHAVLLARRVRDTFALRDLAWMRERAGDRQGAERLYRQALDAGDTVALGASRGCGRRPGIARARNACIGGPPTPATPLCSGTSCGCGSGSGIGRARKTWPGGPPTPPCCGTSH
ncbi:hypothetical protein [Embleya sp. NPDC005971]|uniref:hypothetical protein n=1 Tax=Embleya sp. NPDC005971 TaxID=3156724 RepID=UPI0033CA7A05